MIQYLTARIIFFSFAKFRPLRRERAHEMESATKLLRAAITSSVEEKILMLLFDSLSRDTFISGRNRSASLRTQICFANKSPLPPTRKV